MQALALLDENHDTADTKGSGENTKTDQETSNKVTDDETADSTASGSCSPVDIPALQAHHLQRSLKTLEDGEILIVGLGIHQHEQIRGYSPPTPKNRGRAWAAAIRKIHAPTSIMMLFLTSCSSLFILMYTLIAPTTATTPAMA